MENIHQQHAKVFKALCDPKRLAILEQLRSGEKCACKLQEPLDLTQSGLSSATQESSPAVRRASGPITG